MRATRQSIVDSAVAEWEHWGRSTWHLGRNSKSIGHTDDDLTFARYVVSKYCTIGGGAPSLLDIQDDRYFWSAVGMSAIMAMAGFTKAEFPFAQAHSRFVGRFVAARRDMQKGAAYWAFRAGEKGAAPDVGDIVAYARAPGMTAAKAAALLDRTSSYPSHSDVVVERRDGEIDVIGCNVLDSVTRKTLTTNADGHIADDHHCWFAVLKYRGP